MTHPIMNHFGTWHPVILQGIFMAIAYCVLKGYDVDDQPTNRLGHAAEYDATPIPDPAAPASA